MTHLSSRPDPLSPQQLRAFRAGLSPVATTDFAAVAPDDAQIEPLPLDRLDGARAAWLTAGDTVAAARLAKPVWFTLEELAAATDLPDDWLSAMLAPPAYILPDGTRLTPRPFAYVVDPRAWTGASEAAAGFVVEAGSLDGAAVVLHADQLEAAQIDPTDIRRALGAPVVPIVEDSAGVEHRFRPGWIDLWLDAPASAQTAQDALAALGLEPRAVPGLDAETLLATGLVPARLPDNTPGDWLAAMFEVAARAPDVPGVRHAEPSQLPTRSDWEDTAIPSTGTRIDWPARSIALDEAHAITQGSRSTVVLVVDGGVAVGHPHLAHAIDTPEADFSGGGGTSVSHGTATASVVVGRDPQGVVRGVAPGCTLRSWRISGNGSGQSYALRAAAIRAAVDSLRDGERGVLNVSWRTAGPVRSIEDALAYAARKDVAIVMAAGNAGGESPVANARHDPSRLARAGLTGALAVAATGPDGTRASYSFHGADTVSLAAPGGTARRAGAGVPVSAAPLGTDMQIGTSFAAPCVAGVLALLRSLDPDLSGTQAVRLAQETCRAADPDLGAGHIDAARAVQTARDRMATTPPDTPVPPSPTVDINTAPEHRLADLDGVGPARAAAIVAHRPYRSLWQLTFPGGLAFTTVLRLVDRLTL